MCFCNNCRFLDKKHKTPIIEEEGFIPYFKYKCIKNNMDIKIYVSIKKDNIYNWQQDSEDTQLNNMGCSNFQEKEIVEQLDLFDLI